MIHFDLPKEQSSIIKVIGVGGGGSNAVNHMFDQQIEGVNFIICNTDAQAIAQSKVPNKIQLGPHLTQGLGAGANPDIGRQATEESLEEIKRILEVNTKMAFVTAGMGGGTGTGGAPIISKICKDLGILTVGIVTTPFAYEGKKRQQQAEEGIKILKQYVDTLLVISNDKLRHQFGNLKMREAFERADNVLATAAKCITDVINSTGQINVDFADVCTVMKNGGVAILGSAAAGGDDRAQKAIEEALNSPLLNDNDIKGARWILININSAAGEHEFTMDEVEVIQNYLLSQAGEDTDVILGMGYDNTLGEKIGITLIATGFEHKDPFAKRIVKKEEPKEEKIVMVLGEPAPVTKVAATTTPAVQAEVPVEIKQPDPLAPTLVETPATDEPVASMMVLDEEELEAAEAEEQGPIHFELKPEVTAGNFTEKKPSTITVENLSKPVIVEAINSKLQSVQPAQQSAQKTELKNSAATTSAASGGYLARPSNIYAEIKTEEITSTPSAEEPVPVPAKQTEETPPELQLVLRDDIPAADESWAHQTQPSLTTQAEDPALQDEADEQKRKAVERLQKLRNLSFNMNTDLNQEFENVPAYIRRNMELYGNSASVENFYSGYEVTKDDKNQTQISTINTFLEGKKPD
jgi:cell division protein FtsZ